MYVDKIFTDKRHAILMYMWQKQRLRERYKQM